MALTTHLLNLCLDAGQPLLGGPKQTNKQTVIHFFSIGLCGRKHLGP